MVDFDGEGMLRSVRSIRMLDVLADDVLGEVCNQAQRRKVVRNTFVIERGRHLSGFYGVLEGRLKLFLLSCDGQERVLRILGPGDSFGEAMMFNDVPSPVFVQALSRCELLYFPKRSVMAELRALPDFSLAMLRGLSVMLRELIADLEACCTQKAKPRIARYLLGLLPDPQGRGLEVRLPASKAVVASTLNLSAETFSRELHDLAGQGLITVSRRTVYLHDHSRLRVLADTAGQRSSAAA